jgi:DNA helicase-2/ATP-dependent DNA helicase PcrA
MSAREWSAQQQAIFEWFAGPTLDKNLVVRARAGTGKTTTILEGIDRAPEAKILLCAFNKRIAEELQSKLRNPAGEVKTLHSVGFQFVRRNWTNVRPDDARGERIARAVVGHQAPDPMVKLVVQLASKGKGMCPFPRPGQLAEIAVAHGLEPDEEWEEEGWTLGRLEREAAACMARACEKDGTIDFDDMVFLPVRNRWVRGWWDMVVVDEAQDMNAAQLLLARGACKPGGRIAVVGDDRQAIYGFRGADSGSIDRLKGELLAAEMGLTITYRCPKRVVALAAKLVPDYMAAPSAPEGIVRAIPEDRVAVEATPGDFVLSRKNAPLVGVCLRLLREGKRANVQGKDIGRGLIALLKKLKAKSIPDFLARLSKWEEREETRLKASGKKSAEARIELIHDQADTLRALSEGLSGPKELETRIEGLFSDAGPDSRAVVCSSVHRAKGLEADRVFILEDTLIRPVDGKPPPNREEANIEYVAITRARAELVWARKPQPAAQESKP